jgi:HlyD family secretion protein
LGSRHRLEVSIDVRHKVAIIIGLLAITGLSVGAFYTRRGETAPAIVTGSVTRGPIANAIAATGTLEAVTTVQVGSQVSGTIQALNADFNSIVRKGQVIARLDPALFQTQVDSARANLASAQADVERAQVALADARTKAARARQLADKQLIPTTDLEAAVVAERTADAQVRSAQAQLAQAKASLTQSEVNLEKTVITAPIDGIVIARSVDVGQTVAASLQAPTLFTLAADLSEMQVNTNIDESDLGNIRTGQPVTFRVDAYPTRTFTGMVTQIRLDPVVSQNVVTYAAIIAAPNPALELKPGMTANVTIEVARRDDVLRVPSAALRFRPNESTLVALDQDPKVLAQTRPVGSASSGAAPAARGTVWMFDGMLHAVPVTVGLTDGANTEVVSDAIHEGTVLATRVADAESASKSQTASSSPLMPQGPPRRF